MNAKRLPIVSELTYEIAYERGGWVAKVNFTAARVEAHRCEQGKSQSFLWDCKTSGLGLRATPSGAKAYIFQAKIHGSTVRMTIGDPKSWTIDQAQERARTLLPVSWTPR